MKKIHSALGCILFVLVILLPVGKSAASLFGGVFELASYAAAALVTALLAVCTVILGLLIKEPPKNGFVSVLFSLLAPLSLINLLCYMSHGVWAVVGAGIGVVCCCVLTIRCGKPAALRVTTLVLAALLLLPVGFGGLFVWIFGDFGQSTVLRTVSSPDGAYYAEVIDSDQGALGGNTFVDVYEPEKEFDAWVFKVTKKPARVYQGDWGEGDTMELYWRDDHCLVINAVEYVIES